MRWTSPARVWTLHFAQEGAAASVETGAASSRRLSVGLDDLELFPLLGGVALYAARLSGAGAPNEASQQQQFAQGL